MARVATTGAPAIYAAASQWVEECLRRSGSLFTSGAAVWSAANLDDLHARFNSQPDESSDSFITKFKRQLDGAPAATVQLAAECAYVHVLIAADLKGATKRTLIQTVLSWSPDPVAVPGALDAALDAGLGNAGVAFKTYRPYQLFLIIDLARTVMGLDPDERERRLADPAAFKEMLFAVSMRAAQTQREALLHLVFPDDFEPILSIGHKHRIVAAFAAPGDDSADDIDAALARTRARLEEEFGEGFSFYAPKAAERWKGKPPAPSGGEDPIEPAGRQRAWLVRGANVGGNNLIPLWLEEGFCSIGWDELGQLPDRLTPAELSARLRAAYPEKADGAVRGDAGTLIRFLSSIAVGDLVVSPDGDRIYVGTVTSGPTFEVGHVAHMSRRRDVEWANADAPVPRGELSPALYAHLRALLTVTELTEVLADVKVLVEGPSPEPRPQRHVLPPATPALAESLLLPLDWLSEVVELVAMRGQVIFYGPPGTGKTYVAQKLAAYLTDGEFTLIQFHPSYAYEDFFEGFRPRAAAEADGRIAFELTPGPLREIADAARSDPAHPYVLVIDEINRANLAKVFGELYFLLEYREESVSLQYSGQDAGGGFQLPANLYLIGTMNTADRSIALVDAAMRRRFLFVPFFPDQVPIAGLLRRWLAREGLSQRSADLLDALNEQITDRDLTIGPSYLMNRRIDEAGMLERVWKHAILPLLEEQHASAGVDVEQRFGLASLAAALSRDAVG